MEEIKSQLAENAFRELKEGEQYEQEKRIHRSVRIFASDDIGQLHGICIYPCG